MTVQTVEIIQAWLVSQLSDLLKIDPEEINVYEPFEHYKLSSREIVLLSGDLEEWLKRQLSPTLFYEYPTIDSLARYLAGETPVSSKTAVSPQPVSHEPIAVIGLSCRFPGTGDPNAFWQLLQNGQDAITEVPAERWSLSDYYDPDPAVPGKMTTRWGGFLEQVDQFDPQFFKISPREAAYMDPQQRLLLEVAWEALENAALAPDTLALSQTGVFVGISSNDYARFQLSTPEGVDGYTGTGNAHSIAANRLSYLLNLRGPSLAVDTACSSSLVAVSLACDSLLHGKCDLALAGGVNLILTPELTISFSKAQLMSPDGRCMAFDSRANGYVRGEGCGIVVLKRLSAALEDDDVILALIRGTAVNHDGRSNGLTAPSGPAQRQVIGQALQNANIAPSQISYIEAHGTGTALGDPIEIDSLKAALAPERAADQKCAIGSVKTNIGHLEAAAGIAGLIKVILSLQHGQIPPHLHLQHLNPLITLADTPFFIPTELQPWPTAEKRLAGVSSFGFGGTNVHVVLEEAPAPLPVVTAGRIERPAHILNLSAQSEPALRALANRYEQFLATQPEFDTADLCFTANTGRSHFAHRLSATAESNTQLQGRLVAFRDSLESPGLITGYVPNQPEGKIVFLFTGKGSDYLGMGKQLYATQPTFRAIIRRCDELLRDYSQVPLLSLLSPQPNDPPPPDLIPSTHSVLFALEVALAQLWRSWGIHPDIVMGHSLGEYAAACTAGALTLEQGLSLVAERGQLMESLPKNGMMAIIFAPEARVADAIFPYQRHVAIAAFNGPTNIAISGDKEYVQAVLDDLGRQGVESRPLDKIALAAHSPLVAPIIDQFGHIADQVAFDPLQIPLVSTRTGTLIPAGSMPEADHWRRHLREPVQFVAGVNTLLGQGCRYFLEIGPHPALISMCRRFVPEETAVWLPSLHKGQDDWQVMLRSLSQLYTHGVNADWSGFDQDYLRRKTTLPTYPFQRQRYWIQSKRAPFRETGEVMDNSYTPPPQPAAIQGPIRKQEILSQLRGLVGRALHMAPAQVNIHLPFLEIGADSLVLIETIRVVEKKFNVKLSMRQLFEQLTTLEALSAYIDQMMPLEAAPQTTVPPSFSTLTPTTSQSALENIVNQQLQLMSRQLELLGQAATAPLPAPVEAPPASPPAPPIEAKDPADQPKPFIPYTPLAKAPTSHLSPQQQAHLEALTDRITSRTRKSKQQTQKDRPTLADNRASAGFRFSTKEMLYPIIADRSEGAYIWDIDGNKYVDISMGFGVNLFGHNPPFVMTAIQQQLEKGIQLGPQSELVGEVARLICEMTDMERVAFCNSGTEAVMTALRLARTATGRDKVALFAGSYHGSFDGTLSRDEPINGRSQSVPFAPGIPQNFVKDTLTLEYGEPRSLEIIRAHAHQIAAVLVEPVQSRRPDLQPTQFLHQLREATQENGIALIFDEVITGFRVHPGGAQGWYGVPADIATYGKIIGGGMPIGVIAGKAAYLDGIDGGMWQYGDSSYPRAKTTFFAGTFCKHPLTMSAAQAALNHMKAQGPNLQAALNRRTAELAQHLNDHFRQVGAPLKIVTFGSLFRFAFDQNMDLLFYHLLDKGVYIWEGRNLFLSTAHTEEDINFVINAVKESVADMQAGGFLPAQITPKESLPSDTFILTEAQQQLWALGQMGEDSTNAYNESVTLELNGRLQLSLLREAIQSVINRHEALRTQISPHGDHQKVLPTLTLNIPLVDLTHLPTTSLDNELAAWLIRENQRSFDLVQPPLIRATILKLGEQRHLLAFTAHHIVVDGWSLGVILHEISAIYTAAHKGDPSQLAPAVQFSNYIQWYLEQSQTAEMAANEAYWLGQFSDSIPILDLPTDFPHPPMKNYKGARKSAWIDEALTKRLKQLSHQQGCTLFMTLLTAYATLLHRLTNQEDIVIGIPTAGRTLEGSENMVGFSITLLPVRTLLVGNPTFADYLAVVRSTLLRAYEHQNYPFARLINKLNPRRDAGRSPIVTTTFNLDRPTPVPTMPELKVDFFSPPISYAKFELDPNVIEVDGKLLVDFDYSSDLFTDASIGRLLGYFHTLLEAIATDPTQRVYDLPLLTAVQQNQLLINWNQNQAQIPPQTIHQLFEAQVKKHPGNTAVTYNDTSLTYQELNNRANQLAHYLQAKGVGPEVIVGICLERSPEILVALLAVLKAGGAYVPLDPTYPPERLRYMIADSQAALLLTDTDDFQLSMVNGQLLIVNLSNWQTIADQPTNQLTNQPTLNSLAYVIYTSGSTGRPKGTLITHRSLVNAYHAWEKAYDIPSTTAHLQMASFSFDVFTGDVARALAAGKKLVLCPPDTLLTPPKLYALMRREGIDCAEFVPAVLKSLTQYLAVQGESLSFMRLLIAGSDSWQMQELKEVRRFCGPQTRLINSYGLTEATIDSTYFEDTDDDPGTQAVVPIGRPFTNTTTYILDRHLHLVPIGVPGELHIGGEGLARGYHNRPGLTAACFIPNPFLQGESEKFHPSRLYKTGDLARFLPDGNIEFLGRIDDQVKIRGFRVELGEIEAVLRQQTAVQECVVIAREDIPGNKRLAAYLVPSNGRLPAEETTTTLQAALREQLPAYMIPSIFEWLEILPLTPNGKVNRLALLAMTPAQGETEKEFMAPGTVAEKQLAHIWSQVLHREQIGIHDNFFELGGDSILAIQIIAKANEADLRLTPRQIFQHQTIAELAMTATSQPPIQAEQGTVTGPVPLTPIQKWFFAQPLTEPHHWNMTVLLETPPDLEPEWLAQATLHLVQHHDALRLRFTHEESGWRQFNLPLEDNLSFIKIDLTSLSEVEQKARVEKTVVSLQSSLNLSQGPLLRLAFFDLGPTGRLLIVAHHLIVDGVSWRILLEDLQVVYKQLQRGETPKLPPKTTSFKQWAMQLDAYSQSDKLQSDIGDWPTPPQTPPTLPTDFPDGDNTQGSVEKVTVSLNPAETQSLLQEVPRAYRTEIDDVLLTALSEAFAQITGTPRLLVDLEHHGRDMEMFDGVDLSRTVGWFTAVFPVFLDISDAQTAGDTLKTVKEQLRRAAKHSLRYGVRRYLSPDADTTLPQPQISFNYLGQFDQALSDSTFLRLAPESGGPDHSLADQRAYLLEIDGSVINGHLQLDWGYSRNIHQQETIQAFAQAFINALRRLIQHCLSPEAGGYTPSDFPEADLTQEGLDELIGQIQQATSPG